MKKIPERNEIAQKDKWAIEDLYASPALWQEDLKKLQELGQKLAAFSGKLHTSAQDLLDYMHLPRKADRMKALRQDAYYNALQIKYAYAVTCHKAQGGQWPRVYVDQGYLPDEAYDTSYLRWLYTAFTRATEKLYLVNWPETQTATS